MDIQYHEIEVQPFRKSKVLSYWT